MSTGHRTTAEIVATTHNTARFFTENPHIAWVLLVGTLLWGLFAYQQMPKRKDPDIPVSHAAAVCPWPGASAEKIEQLVTRKIEEKIAENPRVDKIESISRGSVAIVVLTLDERTRRRAPGRSSTTSRTALDEHPRPAARRRPDRVHQGLRRHRGADADGGEPEGERRRSEPARAALRRAIERARPARPTPIAARRWSRRFPASIAPQAPARQRDLIARLLAAQGYGRDLRPIDGPRLRRDRSSSPASDDEATLAFLRAAIAERLASAEFHPDVWPPVLVRDPASAEARLAVGRRRQVQLPRARRVHRAHQARPPGRAAGVQGDARRAAARAGLPRLLAGAARVATACGLVLLRDVLAARNITLPRRPPRRPGQDRHDRSLGRVQVGARDRRRDRRRVERRASPSTCATSSTSSATTRARRGT